MTDTATTFHDLGVDPTLADALKSQSIVHPFPIQELTLPMALKGADLIGQARTGTGKTLAFGLPLLQRIDPDLPRTQALVIVPTRELCLQVADDLTVGKARGVSSIAIYGGVGYDEQIEALTGGVHVVIGTPGRTLDHLNRGNLDLSNVHVVVLDEADEMLDMGFLPDVERLLTEVPEERQTLLFSATMPAVIVKLARRFMTKPTFMRAESEERRTSTNVEQHFFLVHRMDKPRVLARILQSENRGGAFVFTRTKNMADRLVRELEDLKVAAIAVHGDLRQSTREKNLDLFRAGKADVLVATEVAARGLDVTNVTHVFNYDCPDDDKMYLHRIGRTARAGGSGVAVTFAEFNEIDRLNVIRKAVEAEGEGEVTEVFSTSDTLTELFDLPETTPWDHMARGGSGSRTTSRGPSGGGRDGGSGSSRDTRRKSSSDGRNKSRRGSDGSRPASRDRQDRTSSDESTSRERSSGPPREDSSSATSSASRERTRTRSRSRSRRDDTAASTSTSGSSSSSDRPRARTSSSDDDSNESKGRSRSSSGRTRARTSRSSDRRDTDSKSSSSKSSSSPREGSSGTTKDDGGRDRRKGGDRSGSGGSSSRSGSGRSRGGDDRASRSKDAANGGASATTTRRGEAARGDGTPRPRRRVTVDNLP